MNDSSSLIVIVVAFLIGFFIVSKLFDLISKKKKMEGNEHTTNEKKKTESDSPNYDTRHFSANDIDKSVLSILTLIGKFEPNPVDENFDKKLTVIQNFLDYNFNSQNLSRDQITKAIFYSKDSDMTLDMVIYKIKTLRPEDYNYYKKIVQLLLEISLVDKILSADEELTLLKICIDFNIMNSNPFKTYKDNLENNRPNSDYYLSQQEKDTYYGRVLGLVGRISKQDIIKKYKELVIKYHPDKVSHLGEEFQSLAEIKIKEINLAFEYLRKRYNIK